MSALANSYYEPNKLPAGLLALVVHCAFFSLLYFGVNWHSEQPQGMVVDIWNSLPAPRPEQVNVEPPTPVEPHKPLETPKMPEPQRPVVPPKADIALPLKKKPDIQEPKPLQMVKKPLEQLKPPVPRINQAEIAQQDAQAEQDRARAAQTAATGKMLDEYTLKIIAKIRRNIVMPPDVQDNMQAEFKVILLPGGSVLSTRLMKPSGSTAYDDAVDRAITKAQPLPLPPDVTLFNKFRELHLTFKPKEKE
jgi:colicin import membrane protein